MFSLALVVSIGINLLMFVPAFIYKTDKLTDVSYAVTFAVVALCGFRQSTHAGLHWLLLIMVLAWALRLGGFLLMRVRKKGKDRRFDETREHFLLFLRFWLLQGVSVFVIMLAALAAFNQTDTRLMFSWPGIMLFMAGLAIEVVADLQKFRFGRDPKHKGTWIDQGMWRASRHPNYLGEIAVWLGLYLAVLPSLTIGAALLALLSPLYIVVLLLFVSGVPILEKSAEEKWGDKREFVRYRSEVPVLIPTLASIKRMSR